MLILFVCTGNTCRSPLAAAMLAVRLRETAGYAHIRVESAGTGATAGSPASEGSYLVGLERGLDLSNHRSRPLTRGLVIETDLIIAMTPTHLDAIRALGGEAKATTLLQLAGLPAGIGVPDPYGGTIVDYREAAGLFEQTFDAVMRRLPRIPAA